MLTEVLDTLHGQGFRRFLVVNGHGGNAGAEEPLARLGARPRRRASSRFHSWYAGERGEAAAEALHPRSDARELVRELPVDAPRRRRDARRSEADGRRSTRWATTPRDVRRALGDGTFGGSYERPDEEMLQLWEVAVAEVRDLLESGW